MLDSVTVVPAATTYILTEGPGENAAPDPSWTVLVSESISGGDATVGAVTVNVSVSEDPGASPGLPLHCAVFVPGVQLLMKTPPAAAVMVQVDGRLSTNPVIEYALLLGLVTVMVMETPAAADWTTFGVAESFIGDEFDAKAGIAAGARKSIPDTARSARSSPELNFREYAFVGVYIFSKRRAGISYINGMDNLSICRSGDAEEAKMKHNQADDPKQPSPAPKPQ